MALSAAPRAPCCPQNVTPRPVPARVLTEAVIERRLKKGIKNFPELMMADRRMMPHSRGAAYCPALKSGLQNWIGLNWRNGDKYTVRPCPSTLFDAPQQEGCSGEERNASGAENGNGNCADQVDYEKKRETFAASVRTLQDPNASVKEKNLLLKQCIEKNQLQQKTKRIG